MSRWTRWEDWVAVAVGLVVALSGIFLEREGASLVWMLVLGVLLVASGLVNLAMPGLVATEYVQLGLGVLLFIAPWIGGYAYELGPTAWISWIGGAVAAIVAALAIRPAMQMHDRTVPH
ncbi:SPW repeat protein [Agromyces aurantiacus]|uniref:SPW repeat protein n=1 Tax=Agromyces aurantiacus TaxID=165814 RepID=A0ABV9RCT0_9MICO|nr:SPW repeat protein [Agromyces aurantiacus]MBM7505117.1 glycerol uptake facilitator-like aquaporin [Agromyces aurantiacus]